MLRSHRSRFKKLIRFRDLPPTPSYTIMWGRGPPFRWGVAGARLLIRNKRWWCCPLEARRPSPWLCSRLSLFKDCRFDVVFFNFFPYFLVLCCPYPCVVVLQVVSFSFFRLEQLINVVFPALSRSSHCSACFASNAEAWIPFCCFFVHLVWVWSDPHCQSS